jgi:hypothetical protein
MSSRRIQWCEVVSVLPFAFYRPLSYSHVTVMQE